MKGGLYINRKIVIYIAISAATLSVYFVLLFLYYYDFISAFLFVGIILLAVFFSSIPVILFRNNKTMMKKLSAIIIPLILLLGYEMPLLSYEALTFTASVHAEPIEVLENTGIHLMVVRTLDIVYADQRELIERSLEHDHQEIIDMYMVDNKQRYVSKSIELLQWLKLRKDDFAIMGENVKQYLGTDLSQLDLFLERDDITGDSAGLGVALTGLMSQGQFKNNVPIGVTGALSAEGEVLPIGMVKEKILIAEAEGYPFIIVPFENASEAKQVKDEQNLSIEIIDVKHIDEAVQHIVMLNEKHR